MGPLYKWEAEASGKLSQVSQFTTKNKNAWRSLTTKPFKNIHRPKESAFYGEHSCHLGFFCFQLIFKFHINNKKSLCQKFNMTPAFITFKQKCSRNMMKENIDIQRQYFVYSRCRTSWPSSYCWLLWSKFLVLLQLTIFLEITQ